MQLSPVRNSLLCMLLTLGLMSASWAQVEGDEPPLVDGTVWVESTDNEKLSYIVGAADMLQIEHVVQQQSDNPPTDDQSSNSRFWDALLDETAIQIIEKVDAWYSSNPDRLEVPVMMTIWYEYVEAE